MSSKFATPATAAFRATARWAALSAVALCCLAVPAAADKIANPVAVFDGLDKITGRIITFEVSLNETVQFGTLQVTPRVCFSRPPTDPPRTDAFTEVDEIDEQHKFKRIFSGWMFADSPGLHGIEHPIYDVWLVDCKGGTIVIHEAPPPAATASTDADNPDAVTGAAAPASPEIEPLPPPPKRKPKPKAPAVIAAPPGGDNAPLDLGGGSAGNARAR